MENTLIEILVYDVLYLKHLDRKTKRQVKEALTFANPAYLEAKERGRIKNTDSIEPHIKFYYSDKKQKSLNIPKGCLEFVINLLEENNQEFKIIEKTISPKIKHKIKFIGELRPYQKTAVNNCLQQNMGVVQAGTGAGKTVLALALIAKRQTKTLILVHSKELLYQWKDRIKTFLNFDCGLIGDSHFEIKDITVGIINSVRTNTNELYNKFGLIISDEVHKVVVNTWAECITQFTHKYSLGLSATPYRRDGLGNAIYAYTGLRQSTISAKKLIRKKAILKPEIKKVNTEFYFFFKNNYQQMIKRLTENEKRNNLIIKNVIKDVLKRKQTALIVSDRVQHCKVLQELLTSKNIYSEILTGGVISKHRKEIVEKLKKGEIQVVISTVQLIGEGFDMPNLSTLHITTPIKYVGRIIQVVGRILRPSKDKKAIVYDYRDTKVEKLRWSGFARDRAYKEAWGE